MSTEQLQVSVTYLCGHGGIISVSPSEAEAVREYCEYNERCPECRRDMNRDYHDVAEQFDSKEEIPF